MKLTNIQFDEFDAVKRSLSNYSKTKEKVEDNSTLQTFLQKEKLDIIKRFDENTFKLFKEDKNSRSDDCKSCCKSS